MGEAQNQAEHHADEPQVAEPTSAVDETELRSTPSGDEVMELLAEHVPLALLADLAAPSDQVSTEILESEGLPDDAWWETTDEDTDPAASTDAPSSPVEPDDGRSLTA